MKRLKHAELLGLNNYSGAQVVDDWLNRFVSSSSNHFENVRTRVFIVSTFLVVFLAGPTLFSYGILGRAAYAGHCLLALMLLILSKKRIHIPLMIHVVTSYVLIESAFLLYFDVMALSGAFFWSPAAIAMFTIFYTPKKALIPSTIYLLLIVACGLRLCNSQNFQFADYLSGHNLASILASLLSSQIFLAGVVLTFEQAKARTEKELTIEHEKRLEARRMAFVRELIGNMAHEINNPLAIIQASVLRLERSGLTRGSQQYADLIANIDEAVGRVCSVRDGLGLFAVGDTKEKLEVTDVRSLFKRVVQHTRGLKITSELAFSDRSQGLQILCRKNQIGTALVALIVNAQEAIDNRDEGRIRVDAYLDAQSLCFRVTDNGCGIPDDVRDKIFLPFFSTRSREGNRGLGLSVTRGTIAEHGGCIEFENAQGRTRFTIRLPLNLCNQVVSRSERRLC